MALYSGNRGANVVGVGREVNQDVYWNDFRVSVGLFCY